MRQGTRLGVLYALVAVFTAAMGLALPLVPQFLRLELGARPFTVGLVLAVYGILQIVARVPLGAWSDRVGRRTSVLFAFACTAAGGAFFVLAPSAAWVVPGQVLFGLGSSAFWVAANAYVADVLPPEDVPRAMTRYSIAMGVGFLVGPQLSGLADLVGFRLALAVFPALGVAGALASLALLDVGRSPEPAPLRGAFRDAWALQREPVLLFSTAGTFSFAVLLGAISAFLPLHLRALGHGAAFVGVLFTLREGAALLLRLGLGSWLRASTAAAAMLAGVVVAGLGTAGYALGDGPVALAFLSVVVGLGIGVVIPANLTLIASAAPANRRSLAMGLYGTALGVGTSISQPAFGALAEAVGLRWMFLVAGVSALALVGGLALRLPDVVRGRGASPKAVPAEPAP